MTNERASSGAGIVLQPGRERFLARLVSGVIERGWKAPEDFFAAFPPERLIEAFARLPEVRLKLLLAAGIPQKIAARRSASAAREDLELALEEGLIDAHRLLELIPIEARVRHLDAQLLWRFATDGDWLARSADDRAAHTHALDRVSFVVSSALAEGLIAVRDVARGLTLEQLAARLSPTQLRKVFVYAARSAESHAPIDEEHLLGLVDITTLLADLPPEPSWQSVVIERVAQPLGLTGSNDEVTAVRAPAHLRASSSTNGAGTPSSLPPPPRPPSVPPPATSARPRQSVGSASARSPAQAAPTRPLPVPTSSPSVVVRSAPPPPSSRTPAARSAVPRPAPRKMVLSEVELADDDLEIAEETDPGLARGRTTLPSEQPVQETADERRRRAVRTKLVEIGRLPRNHEYLSLHILRSMALMYDEIKTRRGKAARAQCVRECFDNDSHLRTAMLSLIELLDADVAASLSEADTGELIDTLLAQERAVWQRANQRKNVPSFPPGHLLPNRRAMHVKPQLPPQPAFPLTRVTKR